MSKAKDFVYDSVNEAIVIGATIATTKDKRRGLVRQLSPDEFLVPVHAAIWRALSELARRNLDYDPATIRGFLREEGIEDDDLDYLETVEAEARTPKNLEHHIETMQWDATRARVLTGPVPKLVESINDPKAKAADVVAAARAVTRSLDRGGRRYAHRPEELHTAYKAERAKRQKKRNVYPLGADAFDAKLSEGFMPRRTSLIAGVSGSGKSTVAMAWIVLLAMLGRRPLYCAWEMDAESALDVMASHMTGIELKRIIQGTTTPDEDARVDKATRWILSRVRFMGNPFFDEIDSGKKPSNERNLAVLEGYIAESGCDVVVYDLWERMLFWQDPTSVTRALYIMQKMHQDYRIHGCIVQQLNLKDVERRPDKRPTPDSIKGVGSYYEVPDLIFGVHRDARFKRVPDRVVETLCLKQRKGEPFWSMGWEWEATIARVRNPVEMSYDPGFDSAGHGGIGDIGDIKTKKKGKAKIGRRDG